MDDPRRTLPSVDAVLREPEIAGLLAAVPRGAVVEAVRDALASRRAAGTGAEGIAEEVAAALRPSLRRVVNATGVILHTNLGRAPLAPEAADAAAATARYATLEWDPATGGRSSRQDHLAGHLRALTGAEAACVTTSNAGAVLLALVALGGGGEVIVSRGQIVEIGGGFRIPEVLAASGCRLVEVGTTNRTRLADYERARSAPPRARSCACTPPTSASWASSRRRRSPSSRASPAPAAWR
jgi:L-seryl-tRNA(Ser) seleniumtransferase